MNRLRWIVLTAVLAAMSSVQMSWAAEKPADRVVAMYFHRTQRCPTCQKMGAYSEEAVRVGYASQIARGTVEFFDVDFQDTKNAALTQGYKITGPALVVVKVRGQRVTEYKHLTEIWSKAGDKAEFVRYVRASVADYMK